MFAYVHTLPSIWVTDLYLIPSILTSIRKDVASLTYLKSEVRYLYCGGNLRNTDKITAHRFDLGTGLELE